MEPTNRKAKLTHHFRVALKPRDVNVDRPLKRLKKAKDLKKDNIEVITINDNGQEDENYKPIAVIEDKRQQIINKYSPPTGMSSSIVDFDEVFLNDIYHEPYYAYDSFQYDREQEICFRTLKYIRPQSHCLNGHGQRRQLHQQQHMTPQVRAQFVDWLVYVQNQIGLWHETIYMSVKMADRYMMIKSISSSNELQLLYLTSIFISSKFEERAPIFSLNQLIEFAYPVYTVDDVIRFEVELLTTLKFNLRFPLSWGFLRRYAHCTMSDRKTLNLSRFILESSLYDYEMIEVLESQMAAASLLLASKMLNREEPWSETAQFYTGYKIGDLQPLLQRLNDNISHQNRRLNATRTKYSHEVFDSVAKIPPLTSF